MVAIYMVLVGLVGLSCSPNLARADEKLYRAICRDSHKEKLTTTAEVRQLFEDSSRLSVHIECPSATRDSIDELFKLVNVDEFQICSQRKAAMFKQYYDRFMINKDVKVPVAIKSFYIAYGLRVSQICRQRMVKLLNESQIKQLLSEEDSKTLDEWSSPESPLAFILKSPEDFDDLQVPKVLTKDPFPLEEEYLHMQAESVNKIRRQQAVCERRFKLIYEPLVEPVVALSNLGFNYRGSGVTANLGSDVHEYVYQWYRALFMCRSLSSFILVDDERVAPTENGKEQRVRLLPVVKTNDYDGPKTYANMIRSFDDIKSIEFKPTVNQVQATDPILDLGDKMLISAIEKYVKKVNKRRSGPSLSDKLAKKIESGLRKYAHEKMSVTAASKMLAMIDNQVYKENTKGEKVLSRAKRGSKFIAWLGIVVLLAGISLFIAFVISPPG